MEITLDDDSCIHLLWLSDGALSLQRYKAANLEADGHGWIFTGSGVVDAEAVAAFLQAGEKPSSSLPPPHKKEMT